MSEKITYNGSNYYRYPDSPRRHLRVYYHNNKGSLHRAIYQDHFGEIPKGCHIHHKDGNTDNNDISNLMLVSPSEHINEHYAVGSGGKRAMPSNAWHSTEEGKKAHSKISHIRWAKTKPISKICAFCGNEFEGWFDRPKDKFCSKNCCVKHRKKHKSDWPQIQCKTCGKLFSHHPDHGDLFCSRACSNADRKAIDPITLDKIRAMREQGVKWDDISTALNVNIVTAARWLRRLKQSGGNNG